jgi:hypothetical protein
MNLMMWVFVRQAVHVDMAICMAQDMVPTQQL